MPPTLALEGPRTKVIRCPGEAYTITEFICRRRQEKNFEKCTECALQDTDPRPVPSLSLFHFKARVQTVVQGVD